MTAECLPGPQPRSGRHHPARVSGTGSEPEEQLTHQPQDPRPPPATGSGPLRGLDQQGRTAVLGAHDLRRAAPGSSDLAREGRSTQGAPGAAVQGQGGGATVLKVS